MDSFNAFCSSKLWYAWYCYDTKAYFHGKKVLIWSVSSQECGQRPLWFISCDAQPWLRPLQQPNVTSPVKHLRISLKLCNLTLIMLSMGLEYINAYVNFFFSIFEKKNPKRNTRSKAVTTLPSSTTSPMSHSWSWQWFTLPTLPHCPRAVNLSAMTSRGQS